MIKVIHSFLSSSKTKRNNVQQVFRSQLKQLLPASGLRQYHCNRIALNIALHNFIEQMKVVTGKLKRILRPIPHPQLENGEIYLHLGCGDIDHPKFINIDGRPAPHIHYVQTLNNLSQFNNESVDLIYASHCLEHFPHDKVPQVLAEWYRVLKKGGILRLAVPDFDQLLHVYQESDCNIHSILHGLMGGQDYAYNFHTIVFNQSFLQNLLQNTGFQIIEGWFYGQDELTIREDASNCEFEVKGKNIPISLNVQAIK